MRCDLLTDHRRNGEAEIKPRNCLVLGMDVDRDTMEIERVHLARFSYSINDCDPTTTLHLDRNDPQFRTRVHGLRQPAILRSQNIDSVPVDSGYFGFFMDKIGSIDPSLFPLVEEYMDRGAKSKKTSRRANAFPLDGECTMFVPGLLPDAFDHLYDMKLAECAPLTEEAREYGRQKAIETLPFKILGAVLQRDADWAFYRHHRTTARQARDAHKQLEHIMRHKKSGLPPTEEIRALIERAIKPMEKPVSDEDSQTLADIPELRKLLEQAFGIEKEKTASGLSRNFADQVLDPDSMAHFETLGIGGLIRDTAVQLPQQLWKGRYMMMRLPDLNGIENTGEFVHRPCAVWRAFARYDESLGGPVLAGLELHPCTRSSGHKFTHKMGVRPLSTTVQTPSHMIADIAIRVPLTTEYFQPRQPDTGTFFELLPRRVEEFKMKRSLAEQNGGIQIQGMQAIPEDWVEIQLPEPPNEKIRAALRKWHRIEFEGGPQTAPDIRPMGGSANTARRFKGHSLIAGWKPG